MQVALELLGAAHEANKAKALLEITGDQGLWKVFAGCSLAALALTIWCPFRSTLSRIIRTLKQRSVIRADCAMPASPSAQTGTASAGRDQSLAFSLHATVQGDAAQGLQARGSTGPLATMAVSYLPAIVSDPLTHGCFA